MLFRRRPTHFSVEVEEILLDASNIPAFNQGRLEGKRELPISKMSLLTIGVLFAVIALLFWGRLYTLQVVQGASFTQVANNNSVDRTLIIAERGVVYDRNGVMVAWNETDETSEHDFPIRAYSDWLGIGHVLGYVSYPQKDNRGFFYRTEYLGRSGIEGAYDNMLRGSNGRKIVIVDAKDELVGEHAMEAPVSGEALHLSIDAELSEAMYQIIATSSAQAGFRSGAGAIMDVETGEIIALTSFPSYDPEIMSDGYDVSMIDTYNADARLPFLNKVVSGAYTPGSIVKPFVAYGALAEGIIDPMKTIVSTGEIVIPNPYQPENPSRFTDWRAHGAMTMREAIAFSSNVYFYIIGGGFKDQKGLGITKLEQYFRLFGLGTTTGVTLAHEPPGVVPSPGWKAEVFDDDWRLGDTYFTSIGQFGFLTTPLQMLRAYSALANGGYLLTPHLEKGKTSERIDLNLNPEYLTIVHEGMRKTVNYDGGTARALERKDVAVAAKSGTAEVGENNAYVNSWAAGFFPYEKPRYAFIIMMDRAPRSNALGATRIMGDVMNWIGEHRKGYLETTAE